ncbi:MAG: FtsX-like permease family protein [Pseudomonadota bacterium]|nr:FtsX-like permease family protein [Pseudomonadota bacterium]
MPGSLSLKQFWRNLRSGEVRILGASLVLAVAVVTCIAVFTSRLENTLIQQSHSFLGADRIVRSSKPIVPVWEQMARDEGLRTAQTINFASMVFAGDQMHLAAVKAVTPGYPLIGSLIISDIPFASLTEKGEVAQSVPPSGEAWVDSRLLPLLGLELNDRLSVGEKELTISKVILHEPDRGSSLGLVGARVLINAEDLAATEVVQPGSRIRYQLLLGGIPEQLDNYIDTVSPQLSVHQQVMDVESSQQGLAQTLETARKFLMIAAVVGVLLGGVAIAIAARHYAVLQVDQIALLKSLGAGRWKIRGLYLNQLLLLAAFSSTVGLLIGELLQRAIASGLSGLFDGELLAAGWDAYGLGALTGFICLVFFVLPPLWHLPAVPPIRTLRRDMQVPLLQQYRQFLLGLAAIGLLVYLFSGDSFMTLAVVAALLALVGSSVVMALLLLRFGSSLGRRAGNVWRLGMASLERNRQFSVIQMLVFSLAIMLLLSMVTLRTSLIDEWQMQLPEGTPNHFLLNIEPGEIDDLQQFLQQRQIEDRGFYPMIRARLTHVNGVEPSEEVREKVDALHREVNLSWAEEMAPDNQIIKGQWWNRWQSLGQSGVSVEAEVAEQLGLELDDELRFSVGGLTLEARVASVRTLKWDSMNPNFYFLFSPGALDSYYPTYLTSVFLEEGQKSLLNDLLRDYPTILVIEMDRVISQIQGIVTQVSFGVELVLVLVVLGGLLVMWASVLASMDERQQETVLLRALGSSRKRLLGSLWVEFCVLGVGAGIMAVVGSEVLLLSLQSQVLNMSVEPHWFMWLFGITGGALCIGSMGVVACRQVVTVPPGQILRQY